jgi:hypothetical protein
MTVAEVGEGEQGLAARVRAPPSGADATTMFPQTSGEEARGRAGHAGPDW